MSTKTYARIACLPVRAYACSCTAAQELRAPSSFTQKYLSMSCAFCFTLVLSAALPSYCQLPYDIFTTSSFPSSFPSPVLSTFSHLLVAFVSVGAAGQIVNKFHRLPGCHANVRLLFNLPLPFLSKSNYLLSLPPASRAAAASARSIPRARRCSHCFL